MKHSTSKKIYGFWATLKNPIPFNPFVYNKNFMIWTIIGIVGGLISGAYWIALEHMSNALAYFTGLYVIPFMTFAGLAAGLIIHKLGDPGEIDIMVDNIHFKKGRLDPRSNPSMILSSLICIAAGGSLGPEAPLVQVVGSTGTFIARKLGYRGEDVRSITIAGMASAFTALFGAPLGGSLFAMEILDYQHVTKYYKAFMPALVASCASYLVFVLITQLQLGPTWNFPANEGMQVTDIFYAIAYSLAGAAAGWLFIFLVQTFKVLFTKIKLPVYGKMTIGGFLLGWIAYCIPLTRYFGHEQLSMVLEGHFSLYFLCLLLLMKLIAIAITATSGWRGGFIIPLLFAGTVLGMIINQAAGGQNLTLITVCCMAAMNACVTRTPVSIIILLATMTGFHNIAPITFASLTGYFLAPKAPLIHAQLGTDKL